jgi:hypothetical protein
MTWEDPNQFKTWDTLKLGKHTFPGVARAGGECLRALEVLKANGLDGASIKDNGYEPAPIDITVRYLSEDHKKIREIIKDIHPRTKGRDRAPMDITLEQVNFLDVNQVYLKGIGAPTLNDGIGSVTIRVIEYLKEKPAPKPKPAVSSGFGTPALPLIDPFAPSGIAAIEAGFASTEGI